MTPDTRTPGDRLLVQFRCDGQYLKSCEQCHGDPLECDLYYNPREARTPIRNEWQTRLAVRAQIEGRDHDD